MITLDALRHALAAQLGKELTPQTATEIVVAAVEGVNEPISPKQFAGELRPDGYRFAVESFREVLAELHPLHEAHFAETERYRAHQGLKPDYLAMELDERAGRLLQFTLRTAVGALVGNARMYLGTSRHTGAKFAQEDTFFVLSQHRKGLLAVRFWQYAERCLAALGVQEVRTDSKVSTGVGRLNEYLGYAPVSTQYVKTLEKTP